MRITDELELYLKQLEDEYQLTLVMLQAIGVVSTLVDCGESALNQKKYQEAIEYYTNAIASTKFVYERRFYIWILRRRGECFQSLGQYSNALTDYAEVLRFGKDPIVLALQATCYQKQRAALLYLDQSDVLLHGICYEKLGQHASALKMYKQAAKHFDNENLKKRCNELANR